MSTVTSKPRYVLLAEQLMADIREGRFGIGAELPSEAGLCQEFGVSRFTAREALRIVAEAGLIVRRKGSGSRVVAQTIPVRYALSMSSDRDVLRYASEMTLNVETTWKAASAADANKWGLDRGHQWLALTGVRHAAAGGEPIGYTTAFVRADLVDALPDIELEAGAIFSQLSERKGFTVDRIEQEILAMPLPRAVARRLQAEPDAPALTVIRRFWSEQIGAFEVSVNIHPADRFRYSITLERAAMPPAGDSSGPEVVIPR